MDDDEIRRLAAHGLENILQMTDSQTAIEVVSVMLRSLVASCPDDITRRQIADHLIMLLSADKRIEELINPNGRIITQ
jgi:hypothetical protein